MCHHGDKVPRPAWSDPFLLLVSYERERVCVRERQEEKERARDK